MDRNTGANADFQRRNTTANESIIHECERSENQNSQSQQSQNADDTSVDLHSTSETLPEESLPTIKGDYSATQNNQNTTAGSMECLPEYKAVETPFSFNWVLSSDGRTITVKTSTTDNA